jgi:hypothetical protein
VDSFLDKKVKRMFLRKKEFGEVGSTYRGGRTRGRAVQQVNGTMETPLVRLLDTSCNRKCDLIVWIYINVIG